MTESNSENSFKSSHRTSQEKRDKFVSLAENRTKRALEQMKLLGNLQNKAYYNYEEKDVQKIIKALREGVKELEDTFAKKKEFKL